MNLPDLRRGSPRTHAPFWVVAVILGGVSCVLPFVLTGYETFQATLVLVFAIALMGLNILTGYNGQISLGHGAFYAIGAYVAAILMSQYDVPYWVTIPIAGMICLLAGFLFGLPAVKLEGLYLALATFALAIALPQLLKSKYLETWTGGVQGIVISKPEAPFGMRLTSDQWLYFFTVAWTIAAFSFARNLLGSRIGLALLAIRDQPIAARTMGINTALYKSMTFGVSAMFTGVAGALGAIAVQFVAPDSFTIFLSITLLVGVVIGGLQSISGPLYGALFVQFVPTLADRISKAAPWALYGVFLILFMLVMPGGMAGAIRALRQRLVRWRPPAE